jgi:hypothetical protein
MLKSSEDYAETGRSPVTGRVVGVTHILRDTREHCASTAWLLEKSLVVNASRVKA